MRNFDQIFQDATRQVDSVYFHVPIAESDPLFRERVYCYELYHQMRSRWPPDQDPREYFYLNGELDKSGHALLKALDAAGAKPDFLVHRPGYMDGHYAIIEVKPQTARLKDIKKDLRTLHQYRDTVGYKRAMYLIDGPNAERTAKRVRRAEAALELRPPVEIWVHKAPHETALLIGPDNG